MAPDQPGAHQIRDRAVTLVRPEWRSRSRSSLAACWPAPDRPARHPCGQIGANLFHHGPAPGVALRHRDQRIAEPVTHRDRLAPSRTGPALSVDPAARAIRLSTMKVSCGRLETSARRSSTAGRSRSRSGWLMPMGLPAPLPPLRPCPHRAAHAPREEARRRAGLKRTDRAETYEHFKHKAMLL
jgi:hypothetical protein